MTGAIQPDSHVAADGRRPGSQGPVSAWGSQALGTCSFTCLSLSSRVSGAGRPTAGRLRTHGLPHSAEWGHSNTPAAESGPTWPLSPGVEGPQPLPDLGAPRSLGREVAPAPGGAYPGRSCRPHGAGSRTCTRRGRSPGCSHTCGGSRRCALGTHPHLGGDTGPRVDSWYPPGLTHPPTLHRPQGPQPGIPH